MDVASLVFVLLIPILIFFVTSKDLRWAHQAFWSRALRVPGLAGGVEDAVSKGRLVEPLAPNRDPNLEESLVPLLDILNHRPGVLTEMKKTKGSAPLSAASDSSTATAIEASFFPS